MDALLIGHAVVKLLKLVNGLPFHRCVPVYIHQRHTLQRPLARHCFVGASVLALCTNSMCVITFVVVRFSSSRAYACANDKHQLMWEVDMHERRGRTKDEKM